LCYFLNFANLLVKSFRAGQLHDSTQSQVSDVLFNLFDLIKCLSAEVLGAIVLKSTVSHPQLLSVTALIVPFSTALLVFSNSFSALLARFFASFALFAASLLVALWESVPFYETAESTEAAVSFAASIVSFKVFDDSLIF